MILKLSDMAIVSAQSTLERIVTLLNNKEYLSSHRLKIEMINIVLLTLVCLLKSFKIFI